MSAKPGHILVVDDNALVRMALVRALAEQGHSSVAAENGREALNLLQASGAEKFDVVLLDLLMPELDGFQTLATMQQDHVLRHLPVIMISALDEMESVIRCIELGASDYLPKPFNPLLLKARINACLDKKRLHDQEQLYLKALERELEIGHEIQGSFLPEQLPQLPNWEIVSYFQAARQVSGDFYDAFVLAHTERLCIVVADVCDKGVGAALFMALFRSLIRVLINSSEAQPEQIIGDDATRLRYVVRVTNDYVARNHAHSDMFATLFLGLLDPRNGLLTYVNGGHNPPLLVGANGVHARLMPTGPAVGLMSSMSFTCKQVQLAPGEMLVAYTDGVTEAQSPQMELFGEPRLHALLKGAQPSASDCLAHLTAHLRAHIADAEQADDVTLMVVRRETAM